MEERYNTIVSLLPSVLLGNTHYFESEYEGKIYLNTLQPIKIDDQPIESFVLVAINITERKQSELRILAQNEALIEIARVQSHEVRRPVANILGLINLINNPDTKHESELYLSYLHKATKELDIIINEIVDKTNQFE